MSLKIVRNNIAFMDVDAIVNTANSKVQVGPGCDQAIYEAAGYDELIEYRTEHIGEAEEGDVFITPGFNLKARHIIHAVSPYMTPDDETFETKLRGCYRKSLELAYSKGVKSIAFPLISTGSFSYPKEEGMRIAVDEINEFLRTNDLEIYLVVYDEESAKLSQRIYPELQRYIDTKFVDPESRVMMQAQPMSYRAEETRYVSPNVSKPRAASPKDAESYKTSNKIELAKIFGRKRSVGKTRRIDDDSDLSIPPDNMPAPMCAMEELEDRTFDEEKESKLDERIRHISDTYAEYLLYLIESKNMENQEVYKRAIVDKKTFSKIKNNRDYHPTKLTALCLCVGARLNLDETRDLLARAGYALSPCDKTDIIFSFFIENQIYDMLEIDIQLEEHGLPCVIA